MKRLPFKLVRFKKISEFRAKKQLAEIALKLEWFQARIHSLKIEHKMAQAAFLKVDCVTKHDELKAYIEQLDETYHALKKEVKMLEDERELKKEIAISKQQERKIVENIYEKRYTAWQKYLARRHG